jgi:hypothetical protein
MLGQDSLSSLAACVDVLDLGMAVEVCYCVAVESTYRGLVALVIK